MPRKTVRRFIDWSVDYRFRRIHTRELESARKKFDAYLSAARHLLDHAKPGERLIFVGQGMRPIFETVRALNEFERKTHRRNLIYVVGAPKSRDYKIAPLTETERQQALQLMVSRLGAKKKVKRLGGPDERQPAYYTVVDFRASGESYKILADALNKLHVTHHPSGALPIVRLIDQRHRECGKAIRIAEHSFRPTTKSSRGNDLSASTKSDRNHHLRFQYLLREYLIAHYPDYWHRIYPPK